MPVESLTDRPKLLGDTAALSARQVQLREPHIAPLTEFVEALRTEAGPDAVIPYFDPWDGGIEAEVLLLLEAPGPKARGSGFVSRNNPDETAKNLFELNREAGIPRERTVIWNIVPWYIGKGTRIRPANNSDTRAGTLALGRLLNLLPQVRVVVLIGRKAERAASEVVRIRPAIKLFLSPHPSSSFVNRAARNRGLILNVLREVSRDLMTTSLPIERK